MYRALTRKANPVGAGDIVGADVRLAILASLPLLLTACDTGAYYGTTALRHSPDELVFNNLSEPQWIDPGKCADGVGGTIVNNTFEGLTAPDPVTMQPTPGVAERWEVTPDNKTWTFHLRADARWSDGEPVTAADFVWSWARVLDPKTASQYSDQLYSIANGDALNEQAVHVTGVADEAELKRRIGGIAVDSERRNDDALGGGWMVFPHDDAARAKLLALDFGAGARAAIAGASELGATAPDDRTLVVRLAAPISYFLAQITTLYTFDPVPRRVLEKLASEGKSTDLWTRPEYFVSDGPFVLKDWRFRQEMDFEPNPHYWDRASLKVKRVRLLMVDDMGTALRMYRAGEMDWSGENASIPAEYIQILRAKKDFETSPWLAVYYYWLNVKAPGLEDPRVRHALNMAIDKQAIVDHVTRQGQIPAASIIKDGLAGYAQQAGDPYDPEGARKLLAAAGHPGGKGLPPISITFNTLEAHRNIAEAIQEMWRRELGVDAQLANEDWSVFLRDLQDKSFQVARLGWTGDYADPYTFLSVFLSDGGNNHSNWADPEFDRLLAASNQEPDAAKRLALLEQAERRLLDGMPVLPLYWYTRSCLRKPYLKGYTQNILDRHPWKRLWIDPDWEKNG